MATRCIIAEPYGDGWRGRYSHWDGYPTVKVPQLTELVLRDGVEKVRKVLLHDHLSWSVIDPDYKRREGTEWKYVKGYGEAHTDISSVKWFTQDDYNFAWAEYVYVLGDKALFVWQINGKGYSDGERTLSFVGEHRYDLPPVLDKVLVC